jgi:tetratricopeptide (TPR) repeat protein
MINAAFGSTNRFKVVKKLGQGGMGAVYECDDTETGARVALKTLVIGDPSTLLSFKEEFRQFQHIHHANLISLGELFEDEGLWYFTMELVEGDEFITYVRRSAIPESTRGSPTQPTILAADFGSPSRIVKGSNGVAVDYDALRPALRQLALGLQALHDHGKLHCDVKPSNALVTRDGRVVILDFGIAKDLARERQLNDNRSSGTPAYMAPEQAAGMPLTPTTDWYAVGVVLFEALTGRMPFEGQYVAVLEDKLKRPAPDPREFTPDTPEDLASLANELLATRPEDRPCGEEILRRLGHYEPPSSRRLVAAAVTSPTDTRQARFVGREQQLAQLEACFKTTQNERRAVAAYVQGESGVGKSALVRHFVDSITVLDPNVVVLSGACYEHEAVPYKAVDGIIDALSRYMSRLPHATAVSLLPKHAAALAQAFPVLHRVEAFTERPRSAIEIDPIERRTRVFGALRELFASMAEHAPLILHIDDLQWADADSLALLGDVLRAPSSPGLLLLATVRAQEGARELLLPTGPVALPGDGELIQVPRLTDAEARELVDALARRIGVGNHFDADSVAREAQGYPLFLHELVAYHSEDSDERTRPVALEDALWSRIQELEPPARHLLEVVALAPAALMQATATRAAGIEGRDAIKRIKQLKAAHLVRTTGGTRGTDRIEPYHSRTREAVRSKMPLDVQRGHHRRIAIVLESTGHFDPAELVLHWREAGDRERAVEYGYKAAARAEEALAFDRAASHYRMIDELAEFQPAERRPLLVRLGTALANAGRSLDAAEVFRKAASGAPADEARELATRAAELLLRGGYIDEGLADLRRVLAMVDLKYPESTHAAVASLVWSRARLALRGFGFRPVAERRVPVDALARIDACWAATIGLFVADQLRGADFGARHLVLALSAGEPFRVFRGLAFHAVAIAAAGGERSLGEAQELLDRAREIGRRLESRHADALFAMVEEGVAYLVGDFAKAMERGRVAIELLRSCRGVAWELACARQELNWSLAFAGRMRELADVAGPTLREALETNDQFAAMGIQSGLPNAMWLADDDPIRARREADQAIAVWSRSDAFLQHLLDLVAQVGIDLYEDNPRRACERVAGVRKRIEQAGLARVELNRILILDVAARATLAMARASRPEDRKPLLDAAKRDVALLEKERPLWGRALAAPKRACILRLENSPDASSAAAHAVDILRSANLDVYAAACAHIAEVNVPELAQYHAREQIVKPSRFANVFFPGW